MEKPLFFAFLLIGFGLLDAISGLPIDISSVGTGRPEVQWLTTYILTATGFFITIVIVILGCVCCRNGKGFKEFRNSTGNLSVARPEGFVNPVTNAELTIFPPAGANSSQICRFEPLPEIKPQTPNLRPAAFSYREREISSQDWFSEPYDNFPRNQLKYVQEYGRGWFGRVVEGEAQNITPKEKLTKVMVKILHEDATPTDQMYFLHEVKFYRDLKHPNILRLLGRCLETEPFLIILECYPNGDLKTFLSQNLASARALAEQGVTLQMCSNITSGLQFMHENKFIHTDLAARNCLVGPDLTVKIGDYGNSIEIFKSDYYCAGSVALPVRWCAPETLKCTDVTIETREVTPPANIWSLAIVFWEICEFCKLPYAELNDDQVIVRVLGEKNYFLEKPQMFCLHKDELYHLMKLCWNPPVQRPTASQIKVILENLISSGKTTQNEVPVDPKRISQDFEQRWQHLKPNNIPKMDNAVDIDHSTNCNIISSKLKHAKVGDSSAIDSPLGIFMSAKNSGQESPRFCLKSEREKPDKTRSDVSIEMPNKNNIPEKTEDGNKEISNSREVADCNSRNDVGDISEKVNFEYITETKLPGVSNTDGKYKSSQNPDVDSWLKGVEINNEEDENFVRNISEAIRDLDAALALEKTSSSEDNSRKSSHQNSPGKDSDENKEIVIDFKLDGDFSSFMNFTQKSFELSSLQNTEQPQSLNFTDPFLTGKKDEFDDNYGQSSLMLPVIEESKNSFGIKNDAFDESLKENDSLLCGQSRNSSDTDDEIWRKRIEKGEISEKVKEKSKSIANLMILTHIDASDESDVDLDKPFDRTCRNSFLRRSGSFAKSSLSSNNFGSENDITHAVLEDDFKESLKKLSNDHKEHGHFDSLGMILPTSARRENIWENLFRFSEPESDALTTVNKTEPSQTDVNKTTENSETKVDDNDSNVFATDDKDKQKQNTDTSNNFLGNVASEKSKDNKLTQKGDGVSRDICPPKDEKLYSSCSSKEEDFLVENNSHCDNSDCKADSSNSSEKNSSHLEEKMVDVLVDSGEKSFIQLETIGGSESNDSLPEGGELKIENLKNASLDSLAKNEDPCPEEVAVEEPKVLKEKDENFVSKTIESENYKNDDAQQQTTIAEGSNNDSHRSDVRDDLTYLPEITVTEVQDDHNSDSEEIFEPVVTKCKPFKFVMNDDIPEIKVSAEPMNEIPEIEEEEFEFKQDIKPFKFVLKDDEETVSNVDFLDKKEVKTNLEDEGESSKESGFISILDGKIDEKEDGKFGDTTVIIGACEDFTLDYFKGLKTTSEDIALESKSVGLHGDVNLEKIIEDLRNKEENLDIWDKHLEKAFTQQLNNTDFEDISFRSFSMDSPDVDNKTSQELNKSPEKFEVPCPVKTTLDFLKSERVHTDKVEEPIHINRFTNLSGMASEEEYDNFKLRTPDDERSSDSGFRDKGSLSESVEDACEGKYNLEDIEAELEEAYVKGAFGNCEVEKENSNSKNSNNFEYEESKFYEDENKNEEDFSDIDGEIEFWQNKDSSDYYPEISEFNPNCSQGWYLHPPDENLLPYDRNVNEDIVNALRNELRENLPVPTRSFDEFNDFCEPELDDSRRELNIQYIGHYAIPLSPIIEEQDSASNKSQKGSKTSLLDGNGCNRARKNMNHIMESVKSIDTNTFMQYLDFMVENEGRDFGELDGIEESIVEEKEDEAEMASPMLIVKDDSESLESKNFEDDIKNALGIDSESKSESIVSDGEQCNYTVYLEDLESGSTQKFVQNVKPEDDILVVNVNTYEATILESPKPKSHVAFVENQSERDEEVVTDNSDNDGLIFTPELLSPDRERSLSETSRTSNGTRTGDALSEITLSSPDLVPDCFSTSIQESAQNNEADEIINDLKNSGIINEINSPVKTITNPNHLMGNVEDDCSVVNLSGETPSQSGVRPSEQSFEPNEREKSVGSGGKNPIETLQKTSDFNCKVEDASNLYEMSTSFMGDDDDDDEYYQNSNEIEQKQKMKQGTDKELALEDSYTADWESDSTEAEEEVSSSSGEFIWKLYEKSQSDQSAAEVISKDSSKLEEIVDKKENGIEIQEEGGGEGEEEEDDDNESSTGSSASITDFVPSAWNSQATPSRPALKSPDKKTDQQNKKSVWFKKQKYHCVYEYPREPSDNEDAESSMYSQFNCEKNPLEIGNKHFTFEVSTVELPNKHFPYGISNVIDYSSYADWDVLDGDDGDLSLTDTDSDNGKSDSKKGKDSDFNFYNLSPFDYDFNNTGMINDESEFFVSSSSRPFQGGSSSQFFPGSNAVTVFKNGNNSENSKQEESELNEKNEINSKDFVTPDSGVEDSANVSPSDKKMDHDDILLQVENSVVSKDGILNLLDNLKFNFNPEIVENNMKKMGLENNGIESNGSLVESPVSLTDSPSSPLSPSGLGELRHARDKLKLDLPHNHNAELGAVINKKSQQKPLKF